MPDLGQAYVQIIPSAEGISSKITGVLNGPSEAAGQEAGEKYSGGFGSKIAGGFKAAALGFAGFAAAGGAALGKSIADTATLGDHIDKMSQKIGWSAEAYQKWDYVLQRAGTSVDSMAPVMKKLSSEAVNNSEAFQQLGISQEEVANMSQEELFARTIEALSGMENQTERTALASKLLGRGATELAPLLNGGTEAIEEQMKMAEEYGMVMSDESVKAAADFVDAQTTMSMTLKGLKTRLSSEFLPVVTDVMNGVAKMFAGDMSGLDDIKNGIGEFVASIGEKIPGMIEAGGELLMGLVRGIAEKLPELATSAADMIRNFTENIGSDGNKGEMIAKAGELITSLAGALLESATTLIPAVIDGIFTIITQTDWIGLGTQVATTVWQGLQEIFPQVVEYVGTVVGDIMDWLGFSGLVNDVTGLFTDVKNAITAPIDEAKRLVDTAVSNIKKLFPISMGKIFSGIKLPHFRISGGEAPWGIGGMGTRPSVGIDWYAKGGIINSPTVIGVGEAGPEAVVPLAGRNMLPFAKAVADQLAGMGNDTQTYEFIIPVTIDGREVARATATFTQDELNRLQRNQSRKAGLAW